MSQRSLRARSPAALLAAALLAIVLSAPAATAQVLTVDGDLADWETITPHGVAIDPCNELFPLCKSGFDFTRVLVYYDVDSDTLFFGIDIMDVDEENPVCNGLPGPGVPGDADGNLDPSTDGNLPECEINEDQFCVGPDEQYLLKIDTNFDGDFSSAEDLRVLYRGNLLRFEQGDGVPFAWTGEVMLGMKGAQTASDCPNTNPDTEDIEIAVYNYSQLDPVPVCFIVDAIAGSLVDIPPEDFLNEPILVSISEPGITLAKRVRNVDQNTPFSDNGVGAAPGETVEFELTVCNAGNVFLDPVTIDDPLPSGFVNPSLVSGSGCSFNGNTLHCDLGKMELGQCATIVYRAEVAQGASGIYTNTATTSGQAPQEGVTPTFCGGEVVSAQASTRVAVLELLCDKTVSSDGAVFGPSAQASPGQTVTFRVRVTNDSPVNMPEVAFADTLPAGYTNVTPTDPRLVVNGNTVSSLDLGPLAAGGGSTEVEYQADVAPGADGTLVNTADFTGTAVDGTEISTSCQAQVDVLHPAIECEKLVSADGQSYLPEVGLATGQTAFFRVTVRNTGDVELTTASLTDALPGAFSDVQVTLGACSVLGNTVQCDEIGPIPVGGETTVEFRAVFHGTSGSHTNQADVSGAPGPPGNQGDPVASQCSAIVDTLVPGIACLKEVGKNLLDFGPSVEAARGQTVYFRVQVTNTGSAPLYDATLLDTPPAGLDNLQIVEGACNAAGGTVTCQTGPLAPGATAEVIFSAKLEVEGQTLVNVADVTGFSGTEQNPGDETASSCSAQVDAVIAGIACEKRISSDGVSYFPQTTIRSGQTAYFRVTVTNTGQIKLKNVTVEDLLPSGYDNLVADSGECNAAGLLLQCTVASLDVGEQAVLDYHAEVTAENPPVETLVNTADVTGTPGTAGNPGDPVSSQCSATAEIVTPRVLCEKLVSLDGVSFFPSLDAAAGQVVMFKVRVTNDSSGTLPFDEIELTDTLPPGYGNVQVVQGDCQAVGNEVTCTIPGPVNEGETVEVLYRARVEAQSGTLVNTAHATAFFGEGESVSTQCLASVNVIPASITCSKLASKDGVTFKSTIGAAPGQTVWFQVTITNDGDADLYTHSLTDTLPAGWADLAVVQGAGCVVAGGGTISCADLGALPAGGPPTVVVYRARLTATSGTLVNTAQVSGRAGEPGNGGEPVESQCSASVDVQEPAIECEKTVSLQADGGFGPSVTAADGMTVFYRVRVTNTGQAHFQSATLTDTLPAGLGNVQILQGDCNAAGNTVSCDLGPILTGGEVTVLYSAEVLTGGPATLVNTAQVEGIPGVPEENPGDPVSTSCGASVVVASPAISCEKTATPAEASPGQTITFEVTVRNDGDIQLVDVTLDDLLDPSAFADVAIELGPCNHAGNDVHCDLGTLAPGGETTIRYTARLIATTGNATNTASVEGSPGIQGNTGDAVQSECPAVVSILEPGITCDKNVSLDGVVFSDTVTAEPGDTVWFEVLIDNGGDACFESASLEDVLPAGYENPAVDQGAGCAVIGGDTVRCDDLGPLCPGDPTIRVVYHATIASSPPPQGDLVNTATATGTPGTSGNPGDPVSSQCSASVNPISLAIECVKSATPNPIVTGQTATFQLVITNTSPSQVEFDRVALTDTLPAGLEDIVVVDPPSGCPVDPATRTITCDDLGPLAWNDSLTVTYTARVTATNPPTPSLTNQAEVTGFYGGFETSSQCADTLVLGAPAVSCVKRATNVVGGSFTNPAVAIAGQRVFFEVEVTNDGDVPLFETTLTDTLPGEFSEIQIEDGDCAAVGSTVTCDLGPLDPGGVALVHFSARLSDTPPPSVVNTAQITARPGTAQNPGDPLVSSCPVTIEVQDLALGCVKLASLDGVNYAPSVQAAPGQTVYFRVTVTNSGEGRFFRVTLTDAVPDTVFESFVTLDPGLCSFAGNVLTCVFGPLPASSAQELNFTADVRSTATGSVQNVASFVGESGTVANPGVSVGGSCAAAVDVLTPSITCQKGISLDGVSFVPLLQVTQGDHVFFRVTVTNDGDLPLSNVHLEDALPGGYENVATVEPACGVVGSTLSCDLGSLDPLAQKSVIYEADVSMAASGDLVNTALVTADTGGDPVQTSCSATARTEPLEIPTLTEFGFFCMTLLLGASLILHQRRRRSCRSDPS